MQTETLSSGGGSKDVQQCFDGFCGTLPLDYQAVLRRYEVRPRAEST